MNITELRKQQHNKMITQRHNRIVLVRDLHSKGYSKTQIAAKTSIPESAVRFILKNNDESS